MTARSRSTYIYIYTDISHMENHGDVKYFDACIQFLYISWRYHQVITDSLKHQVQLQNYQNLVHIPDLKLLHGTAFNPVFFYIDSSTNFRDGQGLIGLKSCKCHCYDLLSGYI